MSYILFIKENLAFGDYSNNSNNIVHFFFYNLPLSTPHLISLSIGALYKISIDNVLTPPPKKKTDIVTINNEYKEVSITNIVLNHLLSGKKNDIFKKKLQKVLSRRSKNVCHLKKFRILSVFFSLTVNVETRFVK